MNKLLVHEIAGFRVVRGDLVAGGIKRLALELALVKVKESKVACAVHEFGHSGLALALAAEKCDKETHLFWVGKPNATYITEHLKSFSNIQSYFVDGFEKQHEMGNFVENWAKENKAFYLPIGFNCELFRNELINIAKETISSPKEVWVTVGSGTTISCLREAWSSAKIKGVNLGFLNHDNVEFTVHEKADEIAEEFPPYPSALFYDAKIWRFVKKYASKGAVIWNIA